jgi:hypothetical protein
MILWQSLPFLRHTLVVEGELEGRTGQGVAQVRGSVEIDEPVGGAGTPVCSVTGGRLGTVWRARDMTSETEHGAAESLMISMSSQPFADCIDSL